MPKNAVLPKKLAYHADSVGINLMTQRREELHGAHLVIGPRQTSYLDLESLEIVPRSQERQYLLELAFDRTWLADEHS
jgi:hypothetical protein